MLEDNSASRITDEQTNQTGDDVRSTTKENCIERKTFLKRYKKYTLNIILHFTVYSNKQGYMDYDMIMKVT